MSQNLLDRYEDKTAIERQSIEHEYYWKFLWKDYNSYKNWIKKHQRDFGIFGWFWFDVQNFFVNLDESKAKELISFIKNKHIDLYSCLWQIYYNRKDLWEKITATIEKDKETIKNITQITKEDLQFLSRWDWEKTIEAMEKYYKQHKT